MTTRTNTGGSAMDPTTATSQQSAVHAINTDGRWPYVLGRIVPMIPEWLAVATLVAILREWTPGGILLLSTLMTYVVAQPVGRRLFVRANMYVPIPQQGLAPVPLGWALALLTVQRIPTLIGVGLLFLPSEVDARVKGAAAGVLLVFVAWSVGWRVVNMIWWRDAPDRTERLMLYGPTLGAHLVMVALMWDAATTNQEWVRTGAVWGLVLVIFWAVLAFMVRVASRQPVASLFGPRPYSDADDLRPYRVIRDPWMTPEAQRVHLPTGADPRSSLDLRVEQVRLARERKALGTTRAGKGDVRRALLLALLTGATYAASQVVVWVVWSPDQWWPAGAIGAGVGYALMLVGLWLWGRRGQVGA